MDRGDAAVGVIGTATVGTPSAAGMIKARSGGRRRSCNRCSSKKERCDGQEPCQRCMRSGWECLYATCRTLGRPRNSTPSAKRRTPTATALSKPSSPSSEAPSTAGMPAGKPAATPSGASKRNVYRGSATTAFPKASASSSRQVKPAVLTVADGLQANFLAPSPPPSQRKARTRKCPARGSTSMVPASPNALPLKRASFSPSPATGLIGMVQNHFLTCFLNDFSSLYDVLDDVTIRLGLINLMMGKVDEEAVGSVPGGGFPTNAPSSSPSTKRAAREGAAGSDVRSMVSKRGSSAVAKTPRTDGPSEGPRASPLSPGVSQQEDYGINSAVFSAMALGALMLGQQPSEVKKYSAVAKASLRYCGALGVTVPNERVAVAQFLLGIASDIAGGSDYPECIRLARDCCKNLDRCGRGCNLAMREALRYRRLIDALAKPSNMRVPTPADSAVDKPTSEGTSAGLLSPTHASTPTVRAPGVGDGLRGQADDRTHSESRGKHRDGDVEVGNWSGGMARRESDGESHENGKGERTSGDGDMQVSSPLQRGSIVPDRGANGEMDGHCDPGLEAARMRREQRRASCLSMVSDIMTTLSRIPWSRQSEDRARRTREELVELRSLLLVEKDLLEERRRFTRGSNESTPSSSLGSFALANAFIGLHCALEEFEDLLVLAREVAACISACPGLARYEVHGLHTALEILRAFGRRKEFVDLVEATPIELRHLESNNPIEFSTEEDMCSRHVCVMHCRAIREMGKRYFGETTAVGGDDPETSRSMALSPSASTPTTPGREPERGSGESVDAMFRGTEASPSLDGQRMEQDVRRLNGTPEQLSPDRGVKLERFEDDGGPQRPADNRSSELEEDESQVRRLWSRPRRCTGGGQWIPSSAHMKQSSFSLSWVSSSQHSMGSAPSVPASIGNEGVRCLGSFSSPPFSGDSGGGEYGVVSSLTTDEGERPLRQPTGALPSYSRLSSVCGSNGSDGVLPQMPLPDSVALGSRHMMPFTEVLRQTHPALRRGGGDCKDPHGDAQTRLSGVISYAADGRRNGDIAAVAKIAGGPVEGPEADCPLPSLRFAPATSSAGWTSTEPRSLVGGALASLSASRGRGRLGLTEGYLEPMREHFIGNSPSAGTDDVAQHVAGSLEQPSSLTIEGSNTRSRGQSIEDQQSSPTVPLGGGTASPTGRSSPGSTVGDCEEDVSHPPQLWDTVEHSGRVLASASSIGTSEGLSHQPPVLQPAEALEGDAPFWQWGSPPREVSSSAPTSSPSTIPGQPAEYDHVASNGQLLQQASAPLSAPMSATSSTCTYPKRRSSDSTGEWRSGDDRLLLFSSVTSSRMQSNAVGSTAHGPPAVVAMSSSSSPPAVSVGTATSAGVPTVSSGPSGNRGAGNARVVGSVDGAGGQDDHMFMDLLELMDNGENQESAH